jgi:hypothetical protein
MYRKFFAVLAVYPIVFAAGVIWNVESQEDSWAWVGYVLVDVYVFIILLHASIAWLPRPLAAMEYAKYTPLDQPKSSSSINDPTVWVSNFVANGCAALLKTNHPFMLLSIGRRSKLQF